MALRASPRTQDDNIRELASAHEVEWLDNREIAFLIWVGALLVFTLSKKETRQAFSLLLRSLKDKKLLVSWVVLFAWIGLETWVGTRVSIWNPSLSKGTVIWSFSAVALLIKAVTDHHSGFFTRTLRATVGMTVFVEFFVGLHSMSLPLELLLVPATSVPTIVVVGRKPEALVPLAEGLLVLLAVALLLFAGWQTYDRWDDLNGHDLLLTFLLPIWLTVGLIPVLYAFGTYAVYESTFVRLKLWTGDRKSLWRARLALLSVLHFRTWVIHESQGNWYMRLGAGAGDSFKVARGVANEVLADAQRARREMLKRVSRVVTLPRAARPYVSPSRRHARLRG